MVSFRSIKSLLRYGDPVPLCSEYVRNQGGIARINDLTYVVSDERLIREILAGKSARGFDKGGWAMSSLRDFFGSFGLFTVNDPGFHMQLRRNMNPWFERNRAHEIVRAAVPILEEQMATWMLSRPVKLHDESVTWNLRVLLDQVFEQTATKVELDAIIQLTLRVFKAMTRRLFFSRITPKSIKLFTRPQQELERALKPLIDRAKMQPGSLIEELQKAGYTEEVIKQQVIVLILAGFDSTAAVSSWAFVELSRNREVLVKVREEVDSILEGRAPTLEDFRHMPVLTGFIERTLREHPAFPMFFRAAKTEQRLGKYTIPVGATIIINIDDMPEGELLAFGKGTRMCIGKNMSLMILCVLITMMVQRFDLKPAFPEWPKGRYAMTRWPSDLAATWLTPRL